MLSSDAILAELESTGMTIKRSATYVMIPCPFHNETKPSLLVNLTEGTFPAGFFKCYGCGVSGPFQKLLKQLGINKPLSSLERTRFDSTPVIRVKEKPEEFPINENSFYRELPGSLLSKLKCKIVFMQGLYIKIPINMYGRTVSYVCMNADVNSDLTKYIVETEFKTNDCILLFDESRKLAKETGLPVVLVEGPRDALALYSLGIPAVAMLGVSSYSNTMLRNYLTISNKVVLFLDGDSAGREAVKKLLSRLVTMTFKPIFLINTIYKDPFKMIYKDNDYSIKNILEYIKDDNNLKFAEINL